MPRSVKKNMNRKNQRTKRKQLRRNNKKQSQRKLRTNKKQLRRNKRTRRKMRGGAPDMADPLIRELTDEGFGDVIIKVTGSGQGITSVEPGLMDLFNAALTNNHPTKDLYFYITINIDGTITLHTRRHSGSRKIQSFLINRPRKTGQAPKFSLKGNITSFSGKIISDKIFIKNSLHELILAVLKITEGGKDTKLNELIETSKNSGADLKKEAQSRPGRSNSGASVTSGSGNNDIYNISQQPPVPDMGSSSYPGHRNNNPEIYGLLPGKNEGFENTVSLMSEKRGERGRAQAPQQTRTVTGLPEASYAVLNPTSLGATGSADTGAPQTEDNSVTYTAIHNSSGTGTGGR